MRRLLPLYGALSRRWLDSIKLAYNQFRLEMLNVINYKHETNALAYTFEAGSWQI